MTASRSTPTTPLLSPAELARVRRPYKAASLLPGRVYHDPAVFAWERAEILRRDWRIVGRAEEVPEPGSYVLVELEGDQLVVVRGRDGVLRGFHNLCRHRGTAVVEESCGTLVRFQCPYHAWIYDLDGRLVRAKHVDDLVDFDFTDYGLLPVAVAEWQGFLFVSLDAAAPPLGDWLDDLVPELARFDFSSLRVAHTVTYEVDANWKFVAENYSECYHCPGIHPQLNRLSPYDLGGDYDSNGPWQGGWMELVDDAETMALGGGHRAGRPPMCGVTAVDERRVYYYVLWPSTFLSVHPDYLLVHHLEPTAPDHTRIVCEWLFEASTVAAPGFDPTDAIEFWDLTNRQDWHVCELQQRGTRSSAWDAGRYSSIEPSVHAFDLMVADRYAGDGIHSRRTVRINYQEPAPDEARPAGPGRDGTVSRDRSAARRASARTVPTG
jgi:Rieske 2Fe-2S family protein